MCSFPANNLPCTSIHFSEWWPFVDEDNVHGMLHRTHHRADNDHLDWIGGSLNTTCISDIANPHESLKLFVLGLLCSGNAVRTWCNTTSLQTHSPLTHQLYQISTPNQCDTGTWHHELKCKYNIQLMAIITFFVVIPIFRK